MNIFRRDNPKYPYRDDLIPIDEKICELLVERYKKTEENPSMPTWKKFEEWAERYQVNDMLFYRVFSAMIDTRTFKENEMPKNLRNVVSLMQKKVAYDCMFTLTHMLQYENASLVNLEIEYVGGQAIHLGVPKLQLTINSDQYKVRRGSGRGGGGQYHSEFIVIPALPDDIGDLKFGLEKQGSVESEEGIGRPALLILDQPLAFGCERCS